MNSILLEFQQRKLTVLNESLWEWDLIYNIDCDEIKMNESVRNYGALKRIDADCSSLDSIDSITKASVINAVSCHLNRCKGNETRLVQRFFNL